MSNILHMQDCDYTTVTDTTGFVPAQLTIDNADQHFAILDAADQVQARCSIWWRNTPGVDGLRGGAVGHYAANSPEYSAPLLRHACRQLRSHGCDIAIGPLDGCTWRRYRFITERGAAQRFFLEPDNDDEWPQHFQASGFAELARYVSEINPDIRDRQPELGDARRKLQDLGVRIAAIDRCDPTADLPGIHAVVCAGFRDSFLYTPLDFSSYRKLYEPLLTKIDPRLLLVAKHNDRVVGFIFGPPDWLQPSPIDTIVIKTVAILPEPQYRGLGRLLIVELLRNAASLGYRRAISALMHSANRSRQISSDCAGPMRRYAIYGRRLSS